MPKVDITLTINPDIHLVWLRIKSGEGDEAYLKEWVSAWCEKAAAYAAASAAAAAYDSRYKSLEELANIVRGIITAEMVEKGKE